MDYRINKRLDELSLPDLAKLMAEFEQAKDDIAELKGKAAIVDSFLPSLSGK